MSSALRALKTGSKAGMKIGKVGTKVAKKGAKVAKKGAKGAAKVAKSPAGKKALAAAALGGGALYLNKKLKDKSEAVKACAQICLPEGYDEVMYGGKPKSTLVYRTLETAKQKSPDVEDDQPFCTNDIPECGDFCTKKCEELNPLDVPGAELAKAGVKAAKGVVGFAAGGVWSMIKMPVYILSAIIGIVILVKIMGMMKKAPAAPAAPPRYY